jgi:hypothetical protein
VGRRDVHQGTSAALILGAGFAGLSKESINHRQINHNE